ncbi:hypothetical protein M2138_000135 [Dysgonomonadaceae bacterium PH5-43]|nr:hypothetical protein [Dysgonomonadaceae bacterium PH5-43]
MSRIIIINICLFLFSSSVFSSDFLKQLIGEENVKEILTYGSVYSNDKIEAPQLIPNLTFVKDIVDEQISLLNPNLFVECLTIYKKEKKSSSSERDRLALLNTTLNVSSLQGIEYYSKTKGKMRVLYEESVTINNPKEQKTIKDKFFNDVQDSVTVYAKQKDSSFGSNIYMYKYYSTPDILLFTQENLTNMKYGFVTLIGESNLRSVVSIIDAKDHILIYVLSMAKASVPSWIEKRVRESFINRADALIKWFEKKNNLTTFVNLPIEDKNN